MRKWHTDILRNYRHFFFENLPKIHTTLQGAQEQVPLGNTISVM